MRTASRTIVLLVVLAFAFPGVAGAGHLPPVLVRDSEFVPERATLIGPGSTDGTLHWEGDPAQPPEQDHNVREDHRIFSSGPPTNWQGKTFTRVFSSGKFDYFCEVHGASMSGIVVVRMNQAFSDDGFPLLIWASADTDTGNVFDVQFKVDNGDWRRWKTDTERFRGAFGRNDRPVHWDPSRVYRFRARSQKNANTPNAHSRWSPVELFD